MLSDYPRDIQQLIYQYVDLDSLIALSLTNRHFYRYLAPFRRLAIQQPMVWPVIHLNSNSDLQVYADLLYQIKCTGFEFTRAYCSLGLYIKVGHLLSAKKVHLDIMLAESVLNLAQEWNNIPKNFLHKIHSIRLCAAINLHGFSLIFESVQRMQALKEVVIYSLDHQDEFDLDHWLLFFSILPQTLVEKLVILGQRNFKYSAQLFSILPRTNIKYLNITGMENGDIAVHNLNSISIGKLLCLELSFNNISDRGIVALSKAIEGSNLNSLKVNGNAFTGKGLEFFAKSLVKTTITKLDIQDNDFDSDDLHQLLQHIPRLALESMKVESLSRKSQKILVKNIASSNFRILDINLRTKYLQPFLLRTVSSQLSNLKLQIYDQPNEKIEIISGMLDQLRLKSLSIAVHTQPIPIDILFCRNLAKSSLDSLHLSNFTISGSNSDELATGVLKSILTKLSLSGTFGVDILTSIQAIVEKSSLLNFILESQTKLSEKSVLDFVSCAAGGLLKLQKKNPRDSRGSL
ncbi:hypothetical protein HDV01_003703 [Terramyces sp. JEL0728]|nr:hypothetical protein HDV01_003703 [Terramyces sp. JEL0728]